MIKTIKNEYLTVEINETGAEMFSVKSNKTKREYLWQGDEKYWSSRSPVLFPICGRLFEGKYIYNNKEYEMEKHGIVRSAEFTSRSLGDTAVEFTYKSSEETKKTYPFDFVFKVKYALNKNAIEITYTVQNKDKKDMPFSFGAHPAFNVPFAAGEKFEDYYLEFPTSELDKIMLSDRGLYLGGTEKFLLKDKKLGLYHSFFDNDASFFRSTAGNVKLKSKINDSYIEVSYEDMTAVGIWHTNKSDAPFVCIEPWHGIPADDDKPDDLSTKRDTMTLKPEKEYNNTYSIRIIE
ncbi:MAG: aldose 1-epimerase family protein [Clostridia bacterium]|nr:aldose 1-epimerase family protein [Clostridia bacterium]